MMHFALILPAAAVLAAQTLPRYEIQRLPSPIVIDGRMDEEAWPVSRDDRVEIFLSPNPEKVRNYYTFEINATANTPPRAGDVWRLNLMRTGGKTNMQMSTWSPIAAPSRSFHTPESFGYVQFAALQAGRRGTRTARSGKEVEAGHVLYNRFCTMCHGLDGTAGDRAPALGATRRYVRRSDEELFDAIKNGIRGTAMPPTPMEAAEVNQIVAYIQSLRATAADVEVPGNVARGEAVFFGKGHCVECHMVRGRGGLIGPDLTNAGGEFRLEALRSALTAPKENIPRGFKPVKVTGANGALIEGVVKNENNFSVQILGKDGRLHMIQREEAQSISYPEQSLMPANYDKILSKEEFQDLLAFLSRQTRRESR